jgi:hypothetical protein
MPKKNLKDWWQKLTVDWPCALGDWLWVILVIEPARLIDKITRRRVLHFIGILLLLLFFQQVVAMDLTFLFGVDLGLLMEVSAAVFVLMAREQIKTAAVIIRRGLVLVKPRLTHAFHRGARRVRRAVHVLLPTKSSDEDGPVAAFA